MSDFEERRERKLARIARFTIEELRAYVDMNGEALVEATRTAVLFRLVGLVADLHRMASRTSAEVIPAVKPGSGAAAVISQLAMENGLIAQLKDQRDEAWRVLGNILRAHLSGNNGLVMGEANLSKSFVGDGVRALGDAARDILGGLYPEGTPL